MHYNTIISQILKLVPRHQFEYLAEKHHLGQKFRKTNRWSQFVSLLFHQMAKRSSIRDLLGNMILNMEKLYHLGCLLPKRSTLSRINNNQSYLIFEKLFYKLLPRCTSFTSKHKFRFNNKLFSIDTTVIDLCLSIFTWAKFKKSKGAIKLHVQLNHDLKTPEFVMVSDGKTHESNFTKYINLVKDSIVAMDRGFFDFKFFKRLIDSGVFFVTRMKTGVKYYVVKSQKINKNLGVMSDQIIRFNGDKLMDCPDSIRRIGFRDQITGKKYYFLTNNFKLSARTIADIYKERWQIEIFFKTIKQNLKIKTFLGTTKNAVLSQIWVALIAYLILSYLKYKMFAQRSVGEIFKMLNINLFSKIKLEDLFGKSPPGEKMKEKLQLEFC